MELVVRRCQSPAAVWKTDEMLAMTAVPGQRETADVEEVPDPSEADGALLVQGRLVGLCGADREIAGGEYGEPPPGDTKLIIGHEGLGEVLEAPAGSGFDRGDLVVGIVRHPDPVPCPACAAGEWDMCRAMNRAMVLHNQLLFGTVNAGRRHWEQAVDALAAADQAWLRAMLTRRIPLAHWTDALDRQPEDIKVVVDLAT